MLEQITEWLLQRGYAPIDRETDGLLFREAEDRVYVITLSYTSREDDLDAYVMIQRRVEFKLSTKLCKKVECLHVVLNKDGIFEDIERKLLDKLTNVWLIAEDTGRVYIFEKQISEFDGLRLDLEGVTTAFCESNKEGSVLRVAPVNIAIIALNVLYYIAVMVIHRDILAVYDSEIMLSMGALSYDTFVGGAWFQIVTSMFLHFGLTHLGNNMLLLAYTGYELEKRVGSIPYLLLYLGSGIVGNVLSLIYYHGQGTYVVSAGASGAIYGVIGALLVLLAITQVRTPSLSPRRILIMIGITIYHGLTSTGVDNAAHIGGLLAGLLGGFLLSKISQYGKLE